MTKISATTILLLLVPLLDATAQLAGSYTVGGNSPDFETVQAAADSLMNAGIAGSVEFLIRPGIYEAGTEGDAPALLIDRTITGLGPSARITFRSDDDAGGSVANVVMRRRVGSPVISIIPALGQSTSSHLTFRAFSAIAEDVAAAVAQLPPVIQLRGKPEDPQRDVEIVGLNVDGGGRRAGLAIEAADCSSDFFVSGNTIANTATAVSFMCSNSTGFRFLNNRIINTGYRVGGANPALPSIARFAFASAETPEISNNEIDMTGRCASYVLNVGGGSGTTPIRNLVIDGNKITNWTCGGGTWGTIGGAIRTSALAGYARVTNNMATVGSNGGNLSSDAGPSLYLAQTFDSMLVAHNSVYSWNRSFGPDVRASAANGAHVTLINNIFLSDRLDALKTSGAVTRDYNILSNGTELGPHSVIAVPDFVDIHKDLHLGECAFEDGTLRGIARPEVPIDVDLEARDLAAPFIGADEPESVPEVFAGPSRFESGVESFLLASADLDNDGDVDLVVTNVEANGGGNDVTVLWNDGTGTFSAPEHLLFGTDPTHIEIGHLNSDDILDLAVVSRDGIHVRFGAGGGTFSPPVQVREADAWTDLELADYDNDGDTDVFALYSPPADSALVIAVINEGNGTFSDFVDSQKAGRYGDDLQIADLDMDGFVDLLVVDNTDTHRLYTLRNRGTQSPGVSDGFDERVELLLQVSSVPAASRFVVGDFDGDLDLDLVVGDALGDSLVLVRNDGDGTFGAREPFKVHRGGSPRTISGLDYEGDGDTDLVLANSSSAVDLLLNDGFGVFERVALCGSGALSAFPSAIVTAPLDDDASPDVAVLTSGDQVEILHNLNWMPSNVATEDPQSVPTAASHLYPNYPNPFRAATSVRFALAASGRVRIEVFDLLGRRVATLLDSPLVEGEHTLRFDAGNLAGGVYLYRLSADDVVDVRRMVVLK